MKLHRRNVGIYKAFCVCYKIKIPRIHGAKVLIIKNNNYNLFNIHIQKLPESNGE